MHTFAAWTTSPSPRASTPTFEHYNPRGGKKWEHIPGLEPLVHESHPCPWPVRVPFDTTASNPLDVRDALAELARARPHGQLQAVEFRRVCLGFVPDEPEYEEILREVREQAQAKLPARYSDIVTFFP